MCVKMLAIDWKWHLSSMISWLRDARKMDVPKRKDESEQNTTSNLRIFPSFERKLCIFDNITMPETIDYLILGKYTQNAMAWCQYWYFRMTLSHPHTAWRMNQMKISNMFSMPKGNSQIVGSFRYVDFKSWRYLSKQEKLPPFVIAHNFTMTCVVVVIWLYGFLLFHHRFFFCLLAFLSSCFIMLYIQDNQKFM